jgi:predicted Zn finger-like uncharacterized protein
MGRMHVICPACGTHYHITSRRIDKVDKGNISCYTCNTSLFEYDGCISYYPFMITQDDLQDIDGLETGGFSNN